MTNKTSLAQEPSALAANDDQSVSCLVSVLVRSMARITLQSALDSAAAQDYPDVEIVVVAAIGAEHPPLPERWNGRVLRLLPSELPLSRSAAANRLLAEARGEFVIFLDDDDQWRSWHLSTLVSALRNSPAVSLAYSRAMIRDEIGRDRGALGVRAHPLTFAEQSPLAIHTALLRSTLLAHPSVRFDESLDVLEDLDFFIACAAQTPFAFVPEVTAVWYAASGESGHGLGANATSGARERGIVRIREKWAHQFERWQAEPMGQLDLAELYLRNGDLVRAERMLFIASKNEWKAQALLNRFLMLCQETGLVIPAAGSPTTAGDRIVQMKTAVSTAAMTGQKA